MTIIVATKRNVVQGEAIAEKDEVGAIYSLHIELILIKIRALRV